MQFRSRGRLLLAPVSTRLRLLFALLPPLFTFLIIHLAGWDLSHPYASFLLVLAVTISAWIARDTSDLRRARKDAELLHQRLRSVFDGAPDGIFAADLDGRYIDANAAGCRIVGYSREELVRMRIYDLIRPEDVARLERDKVQLLAGHAVVGEWWLRRKDGTYVPVELNAKILSDGRWEGFVRDITRRKRLENALAAKSADFDRAQSLAQIGSWRLDSVSDEPRFSDEAYRIFAVPIGTHMTFARFLETVHPEDRAYVDRMWTAALGGEPYDIEHRLLVDGHVKWVREKAAIELDDRGSLVGCLGITQDITERKRLEGEVRQAQERIELALKGADLAAWDWNIATGEVLFNARWAEMRGYTADEIMPTVESWSIGIHPEDLPRVRQELDDHFAGLTSEYACEFRVQTKSGSWIWILDRGKVFARNAQGKPTRMLGTVLDITTRKQADLELRLAHQTTSGILSISADAIVSIDEDQRITMFNEGAEKIFGYTKAEAIGAPVGMLSPERTRADLHKAVARFAAGPNTARRLDKGEPQLVCVRKNGDEFPTETAISKLEVGGHKILTATIRDVTQERRVEHEQRFLAEVGPVLASSLEYEKTLDRVAELAVREIADLCIVDIVSIDGQIRRLEAVCRDPAKKWIADGLKRVALDPGSPFLTMSAFADQEPQLIERVSNHTVASFAQNAEHLNLLRALDIKSLITVPLVTHRKLVGAIALVASASSRRFGPADLRLAQELAHRAALAIENARLYKVAQIAIQARDDLAGVVAHDLRNPLNAIGLQADTLDDRKIGDGIRNSVTRMNRIIQDLLDVTQLEAGQLSVERSRLSMTGVLLDVVEAQRPLADKRRLALLLEIPPDLPEVLADRDRLLQIFENLISNAIKFTRHGSVTVGAVARDGELEIWVRDTGMGLAAELLPHLFDRFWQADKAARHGAGLGLPIVKGLVEAHGGRVWVESAPGAGFCFYFTIPQAPPSVEARDESRSQHQW